MPSIGQGLCLSCHNKETATSREAEGIKQRSGDQLLLLLSDDSDQVDYLVAEVYVGFVSVSIILRPLTWTAESLTCECDLFACVVWI